MNEKPASNENASTILFGDDEQYALFPLKTALYSRGYKILQAASVSEVIHALKSEKIDVLVLDIMMDPGKEFQGKLDPHLAGIEALDLIKEVSPKTSIICLSVVQDYELIKKIKNKGAIFLGKGETSLKSAVNIIESKITGVIKRVPHESRRIFEDY
jgi:DNA-binding NarL/FixJ family response regulator